MATPSPLNNEQVDPDFIPEEQMAGQQTAQDDPDFIPEEQVDKDPSLLQKGVAALEMSYPNATSATKNIGGKFKSALDDVFGNPVLQHVDPVNKIGLTLQNTAQSIFDEGGDKTAERLAANGMNPYVAATAGLGIQMFPDLVFTAEGVGAMKAAGNAAAESRMLQNVIGKLKTAAPLQLGYEAPIAAPIGEIASKEAIPLESKALSLLKGKAPLALPEPKVVQGPKQTVGEKFGISIEDLKNIEPEKNPKIFEQLSKRYKKEGTPGIKINKGIYDEGIDADVTHSVLVYDKNGKLASVLELDVINKDVQHIAAASRPGYKPVMTEVTKKLAQEGYSLNPSVALGDFSYTKSGKKALARILNVEAEPGFTMTDQSDLAKIQSTETMPRTEFSSKLKNNVDIGIDSFKGLKPEVYEGDIGLGNKAVGSYEIKLEKDKIILRWASVNAEYRERGIASDFITSLENKAKEAGIKQIEIVSMPHAESYWSKFGYNKGNNFTKDLSLEVPKIPMQRGAQPTYPGGMKGPSEIEAKTDTGKFDVAIKYKGKVYAGKPGDIHADMTMSVPWEGEDAEDFGNALEHSEFGFVKNNKFYTREEAAKITKTTNPVAEYMSSEGHMNVPASMKESKIRPGESLKQYAARKKLSADVPDFKAVHDNQAVAPADYNAPSVTDMMDESRAQYSGVDSRLKMETDSATGRTMFKLRQDPPRELGLATEAEVASNQATKASPIVKELGIDPRMVDSSPVLPGSQQVPVLKPEIVAGSRSFIGGVWNRIGAASEAVVSRMGQAGKELAQGIRIVRDVPQVRYGEFSADFDQFLKGLSKKQAKEVSTALADTLEGSKASTKLPNGLVDFVRQKLKVIADEAASLEMTITNSKGETVPFAPRENFFPRVVRQDILDGLISGDNKVMSQVAQAMVNNRQEANFQIAFERVKFLRNKIMLHKYGHLERAREFELPPKFYDKNSLRVIPEYINSALHRIEEVRQFGAQGEKALEVISRIKDEGHDADLARRIFERFTRIEPRDAIQVKAYQGLRNMAAGMLIQAQSTILQVGQVLTPAYEAGFVKAVKGFAKAFTSLGDAEAKRAGQVFTTAATDYIKEAYGGAYGFAGKFADKMLNITGFARMDHFLRKYSALVGKDYIDSLVTKLVKNNNNKEALVELQHLGFDTNKIIRNKGISALEHNVGAKVFADSTQGAPDSTRLPHFWTSPEGKLFAQFKNFSYVIGKENASMIKRALQTGNVTRLGEMAVGLPLSGYAIKSLRDAMAGESNSEVTGQEDVDAMVQVLANATAFGPAVDLFLLALQGPSRLNSFFLPIGVKNVTELAGSAGKSIKEGSLEPFLKTATKKLPVAGRFIANKIWGE